MAAFYNKDFGTRRALTKRVISEKATLLERWQDVTDESKLWTGRAQRIASLIRGQESVVDLGCGTMQLEHFLPPTVKYLAVDVVRRDDRTIVVDLNTQALPHLMADCLVAAGILEYIHDVPKLLLAISRSFKTSIVSYNILEKTPSQEKRESHAWVNSYTLLDLESEFLRVGLTILERLPYGSQIIWKLSSSCC
jgi:hypothetical protein